MAFWEVPSLFSQPHFAGSAVASQFVWTGCWTCASFPSCVRACVLPSFHTFPLSAPNKQKGTCIWRKSVTNSKERKKLPFLPNCSPQWRCGEQKSEKVIQLKRRNQRPSCRSPGTHKSKREVTTTKHTHEKKKKQRRRATELLHLYSSPSLKGCAHKPPEAQKMTVVINDRGKD